MTNDPRDEYRLAHKIHEDAKHGGWREPQLHDPEFDPHYRQWRAEQLRSLDEDYRSWRQDRYKKFSDDFSSWRSNRSAAPADAGSASSASAAADASQRSK